MSTNEADIEVLYCNDI